MAGDWIKMRSDLFTHPKVVRISSALKADTLRTVGGLMSVWCLFDAHSVDGELEGYTLDALDDHLRWPGFALAMVGVKWLEQRGESLVLPEFDTHNGASAKRRAQDADRKRGVRKESAPKADKKRTREEKRREEEKNPLTPLQGEVEGECVTRAKTAVTLKAFIETCRESGERAIPENDPVMAYADEIGLPREFLALAWSWFKVRYADGKRQKDWRAHFRNAVRSNWPKFWYADDAGGWQLTTAGKQAQREAEAKA